MRTFKLVRDVDVSGVSGTGIVAEGVVFHDGRVAMSWLGVHHTVELADNVDDLIDIHGHGGATRIEFDA